MCHKSLIGTGGALEGWRRGAALEGWRCGTALEGAAAARQQARPGRRQPRSAYSLSSPREMIVFWISDVPSPMSRNGASRMSRSISYSLE